MLNSLDLLIIVVMALMAVSLVALALMYLVKNKSVSRVCFYIAVAFGVYIGTVGFRINWPGFFFQSSLAVVMALVSIAALVLERVKKGDEKSFRLARLLATAALAVGLANAFLV